MRDEKGKAITVNGLSKTNVVCVIKCKKKVNKQNDFFNS